MTAFLIALFFLIFVSVAPEVFMAILNYIIIFIVVIATYLFIDHKIYLEKKKKIKDEKNEKRKR